MKLNENIEEKLNEIIKSANEKYNFDVGMIYVETPFPYEDLIKKYGNVFHGYPIYPNMHESKNITQVIVADKCGYQLGLPYFMEFYDK